MKYTKEEYRDGTAMWKFENGITVYSKEWSYCDYAFDVYNADGKFLGGIYPDTDEDSESCVKDLDDGSEPITDGWEDGCGNSCSIDGWGDGLKDYNNGKLTKLGWKNLIEDNRNEIEETLKDALRLSYENHNLCRVLMTPDEKLHTFEDVSHGRETIEGDYLEIASFDKQFDNPIDDYFDDVDVLLESYERELSEIERKAYNEAVAEFESDGYEMDVYQRINWIYENCQNAVNAIYEYAWKELCSDMDFDEIINDALAEP